MPGLFDHTEPPSDPHLAFRCIARLILYLPSFFQQKLKEPTVPFITTSTRSEHPLFVVPDRPSHCRASQVTDSLI